MMLRSAKFGSVARRCIATLPDNVNLNHPKIGIVKNILKLRRIAAATCETTLKAALTDPVTIEQVMTQPELTKYEMLLVCGTNKIYHAPFVKNPNVWQNFGWGRLINHEMRKTVNYGFFLGFVCLGWFVAWYVPSAWAAADPDTVRRSGYLSMLEGRGGHIRTKEEHAVYLAEKAAKQQ